MFIFYQGGRFSENAPGKLYAWGDNSYGQLGDGGTGHRSSPVAVLGAKTFVKVAGSWFMTAAIDTEGYIWTWGNNWFGQLGDNTRTTQYSPVSVVGGRKFIDVQCGNMHTVALDTNSYAWAWGNNGYGQLGTGAISTNQSSPVSLNVDHPWTKISVGGMHTLGIDDQSYAWAWGLNSDKQLCSSNTSNSLVPRHMQNSDGTYVQNVSDIEAGYDFSMVASINGIYMCGDNTYGQLGNGTTSIGPNQYLQFSWLPHSEGDAISSGFGCAYAMYNGSIYCSGKNDVGQLGDGTTNNHSEPVSVVGVVNARHIKNISDNDDQTLIFNGTDGTWACGYNGVGSCGDNTTNNRSSPVAIVGKYIFNSVGGSKGIKY